MLTVKKESSDSEKKPGPFRLPCGGDAVVGFAPEKPEKAQRHFLSE